MAKTEQLINYYGKFNEENRLGSRHGQVEFRVSMKYILDYLADIKDAKILDIGAGTGRYSVTLANMGYDVTALELVKSNLGTLKAKKSSVKAYQGNALDLSRFEDESFDLTLLFGPMYHLHRYEDKLKALNEAKRVTKKGGYIFVAYVMNDYSVITYAFKENHIKECLKDLDENFHIIDSEDALYSQVRLEDINQLDLDANLSREKIFAPDGPSDYMRPTLNAMDEESFEIYIKYIEAIAERQELIGASSHTVDILRKE